jgi:hypothetical protein
MMGIALSFILKAVLSVLKLLPGFGSDELNFEGMRCEKALGVDIHVTAWMAVGHQDTCRMDPRYRLNRKSKERSWG